MRDPKNYTALLFDLDNTLLDFDRAETAAFKTVYDTYLKDCATLSLCKSVYQNINKPLWEAVHRGVMTPTQVALQRFIQLAKRFQVTISAKAMADTYETALSTHAYWFPGALETIHILKQHYRIGIITNGLKSVQRRKYELNRIDQWCECYIISEEVGLSKPDPKIFAVALQQMQLQPEQVLMIGDSLTSDYQGALNAGIDFCWINVASKPLPAKYPPPQTIIQSVSQLHLKEKALI